MAAGAGGEIHMSLRSMMSRSALMGGISHQAMMMAMPSSGK